MSEIKIFFEFQGEVVQLPYNPEGLEVTTSGNNETAEIISLGEINILKDKKLSEISIKSFLPNDVELPFVLTKNDFKPPTFYIEFFEKIQDSKNPLRFTVTSTPPINMLMSIEDFIWSPQTDDSPKYNLSLKKYKPYAVKAMTLPKPSTVPKKSPSKTPEKPRENANKSVTVGCEVIVNGRLHRDSFGAGAGQTRTNYKGKVNFIEKGKSHPYHITDPSGGWQGWVTAGSVKVV